MVETSIPQVAGVDGLATAVDWEEQFYVAGCDWAKRATEKFFAVLDEQLYEMHPAGWCVVGFRERWLVTRYGEVRLRRRLYQDEAGTSHFLVDEYLKLPVQQAATPSLQSAVVGLAGEVGFAKVARHVAALTAAVLSPTTVWRLTQRVGATALAQEAEEGEAVYRHGQRPVQEGRRGVERLFVEADGVFVRLQRAAESHLEIKSAIAYEGWERLGDQQERYRLQEKRVYVHGVPKLSFWEGAGLALGRHWDWSCVRQVVVGGDGAAWIAAGTDWLPGSLWQLDGFHLARATGRALGREHGQALYQAMRAGDFPAAHAIWQQAPRRKNKSAQRPICWLDKLLAEQQGQDWRCHLGFDPASQRGLGAMEGNGAHLIADRMKGKGRSWSPSGARHIAKVRELLLNDELDTWCRRKTHMPLHSASSQRPKCRKHPPDRAAWLQATVPVLHGPHSQRPWVRYLFNQIHCHRLI